ncbi:MAG TPA: biotin-dependent carboxyltransferase family protein [Longimicrobiaceae bacterium]|nr:biotin-dependent carboxyltransferase family protein [Longimicrobiaceae bacterium]
MIHVERAPAYLAVQDAGWSGLRSAGMPVSGAMDGWALRIANLMAGNAMDAAVLEWALGPGVLRFSADCTIALAGAAVTGTLAGAPLAPHTALRVRAGDELRIDAFTSGRFAYLAVSGGVLVEPVLGSRSTYLPGAFGGYEGRLLRAGDALAIGTPDGRPPPPGWMLPEGLRPAYPAEAVLRAVAGPQAALFDEEALRTFESAAYRGDAASDRAGYRLRGPAIAPRVTASLPSEAACPGAVQVPDGGQPIVLMPDGPTVGGYPKIAVVASADLPLLAQCVPGSPVRFRRVPVDEAQQAYRRRAIDLHTVAETVRRACNG